MPALTMCFASWNLGSAASASLKSARPQVVAVVSALLSERPLAIALQEAVVDMRAFVALFPGYSLRRPSDNPKSDHAFLVRDDCVVLRCSEVRVATWVSQMAGAGHSGRTTRDPPAALVLEGPTILISIHAPPARRDTRVRDVFLNRLLRDDCSVRAFARSIGISARALLILAGDFNVNPHHEERRGEWHFSGDEHTWTANSGGLDFFAVESERCREWTMTQHEITQRRRKDPTRSVAGASNHDPIILTMRSRVSGPSEADPAPPESP